MSTHFSSTGKKESRVKIIKETTEFAEHKCDSTCLSPTPRPTPINLRKISLGYIYDSDEGFFIKWGKDDWLEVVGLTFCRTSDGQLVKMFEPAVQLHIHSPGGRTIEKAIKQKEIRVNEAFHAQEAAKKLKRKGLKLRDAQGYLGAEAAKVIPYAKSPKKPKGTGRGAPGMPRSDFSKEVVFLIHEGKSQTEIIDLMVIWSREHGNPVAGPFRKSIEKRVKRWYFK